MEDTKAVFAVHDSTTQRNLSPVVDHLPDSVEVEYLFLDELFDQQLSIPATRFDPKRFATDYTRYEFVVRMNQRIRPGPLHVVVLQHLVEDRIDPKLSYRLEEYLRDADPDLFVCGHDRLPFIKHVIKLCHDRGVPSVVVQHGIQNLRHDLSERELLDYLRPSEGPASWRVERFKRWLLYRYGAYIFCNPYVDEVHTIGDFFTDEIRDLRRNYPSFGKTDVITTGYPEYDLSEAVDYDPEIDSALFLSGWEYEAGEWGAETQRLLVDRLKAVEEANGIPVTVRPHPKDSERKISAFFDDFPISRGNDLIEDIREHDLIVSAYSTALLLAAAEGKPCGVIGLPWEQNRFGPFRDTFMIQLTEDRVDVHERAALRTVETQHRFLEQYCYIPAIHSSAEYRSPSEYIAARLVDLIERR